ncbi:MAG: hypothetical protein KA270_02980 [Saprospiraceae bacterium]|nr:hypothetical protein [Saprospiraceae bacterium]
MKTNKELKEFNTQIELLNDTIQYYWGKPERKSFNDIGLCSYYPGKNEINHTNGCAIGRLISDDLAIKLDDMGMIDSTAIYNDAIFYKLPDWLKKLGKHFLEDLQQLHDNDHLILCNKDMVIMIMKIHVNPDEIIFPN